MPAPRITRSQFHQVFDGRPVALDQAWQQPEIQGSPGLQRLLDRVAGADRVIDGRQEVDRLYDEYRRWFNDKPAAAFWDRDLHARPGGATANSLRALSRIAGMRSAPQRDPAEAAGRHLVETTLEHRRRRAETGIGTHYGEHSAFASLSDSDKAAYLAQKQRPGSAPVDPASLTPSSCVGWAMENVEAYYRAAGRLDKWQEIQAAVKADGMRGTSLARELQADGWKAFYNNPDTSYAGGAEGDNEHAYTLHQARTRGEYYGVPLDGEVTDWARDPGRLRPLEQAPFFVHVARGGYHVTAGTRGEVNELAYSQNPDQPVIYQDSMARIVDVYGEMHGGGVEGRERALRMWGSGVTLVPPAAGT